MSISRELIKLSGSFRNYLEQGAGEEGDHGMEEEEEEHNDDVEERRCGGEDSYFNISHISFRIQISLLCYCVEGLLYF